MAGPPIWGTTMPATTITMSPKQKPIRCIQCHGIATGVYQWDTSVFGRTKVQSGILCASCALDVPNKVRMYEDGNELRYYKPNSNLCMMALFEYPLPPCAKVPEPLPREKRPTITMSGLTAIALARLRYHDPHLASHLDTTHKGRKRRRQKCANES